MLAVFFDCLNMLIMIQVSLKSSLVHVDDNYCKSA